MAAFLAVLLATDVVSVFAARAVIKKHTGVDAHRQVHNVSVLHSEGAGHSYLSLDQCLSFNDWNPSCELQVKATLSGLDRGGLTCSTLDQIDSCIGAVLSTNSDDFAEHCCGWGTEYDHFILSGQVPSVKMPDFLRDMDSQSAVIVVDMQRDFTLGSFAQPCYDAAGQSFASKMASFIEAAAGKGATIIASKDFHVENHCSFHSQDSCKNTKDYDHLKFTADQRYVNQFPSHCEYSMQSDSEYPTALAAPATPFCKGLLENVFKGKAPPGHFCGDDSFIGSHFDPQIREALGRVPPDQLEVVFKGIDAEYDSFSVLPHLMSKTDINVEKSETQKTGGFALPKQRARDCHGVWDEKGKDECLPTKRELGDPHGAGLRPVINILKEKGIKRLFVVGLVYDYCVKETAIFAKEASGFGALPEDFSVTVVAHLTRPAADGKPGFPYVSAVCDGEAEGSFCKEGGATASSVAKVKRDFDANGVVLKRILPESC